MRDGELIAVDSEEERLAVLGWIELRERFDIVVSLQELWAGVWLFIVVMMRGGDLKVVRRVNEIRLGQHTAALITMVKPVWKW